MKGVQSFIGFCNFYWKFIPDFSTIAWPLHNLTKMGAKWNWTTECNTAFRTLQATFTQGPVLTLLDTTKPFTVMTDASLTATGAVLMQTDFNGDLHPCTFLFKTLSAAERNYNIFDHELLAIIPALTKWKHYLQGTGHPVTVVTDHKNLSYFKQPHKLFQWQVWWMLFLQDFDLVFLAMPGLQMGPADALSHKDEVDTSKWQPGCRLVTPYSIYQSHWHCPCQQNCSFLPIWPACFCCTPCTGWWEIAPCQSIQAWLALWWWETLLQELTIHPWNCLTRPGIIHSCQQDLWTWRYILHPQLTPTGLLVARDDHLCLEIHCWMHCLQSKQSQHPPHCPCSLSLEIWLYLPFPTGLCGPYYWPTPQQIFWFSHGHSRPWAYEGGNSLPLQQKYWHSRYSQTLFPPCLPSLWFTQQMHLWLRPLVYLSLCKRTYLASEIWSQTLLCLPPTNRWRDRESKSGTRNLPLYLLWWTPREMGRPSSHGRILS